MATQPATQAPAKAAAENTGMACLSCNSAIKGTWEVEKLSSKGGLSIKLDCKFDCDNQSGKIFCFCNTCYLARTQAPSQAVSKEIADLKKLVAEKDALIATKTTQLEQESKKAAALKTEAETFRNQSTFQQLLSEPAKKQLKLLLDQLSDMESKFPGTSKPIIGQAVTSLEQLINKEVATRLEAAQKSLETIVQNKQFNKSEVLKIMEDTKKKFAELGVDPAIVTQTENPIKQHITKVDGVIAVANSLVQQIKTAATAAPTAQQPNPAEKKS